MTTITPSTLATLRQNTIEHQSKPVKNKEDVAIEFERIFAKSLVEEMTKGLFEGDKTGAGVMNSGNHLYRDHIIETLSAELAKQEPFGFSEMVRQYLTLTETTE